MPERAEGGVNAINVKLRRENQADAIQKAELEKAQRQQESAK